MNRWKQRMGLDTTEGSSLKSSLEHLSRVERRTLS